MQRFDPFLSAKNEAKLNFEDIIDLKEFYENKDKQQLPKYTLFSIINHVGNINYGIIIYILNLIMSGMSSMILTSSK